MDFSSFDGTALEAVNQEINERDPLTVYSAVGEKLDTVPDTTKALRAHPSLANVIKAAKSFRESNDAYTEKLLSSVDVAEEVLLTPELEDAIFNSDFSAA